MNLRVLGIDPGTAATGFAVLERRGSKMVPLWYDCLRTTAATPPAERLATIHTACVSVIRQFEPHAAAIEGLFFGVNAQSALQVGQARGVLVLACHLAGVDVHEYSPAVVKQSVTGYGQADKHQVQRMVQTMLGMSEPPRPDHAADAFAVAICHAGSADVQGRIQSSTAARTTPRRVRR